MQLAYGVKIKVNYKVPFQSKWHHDMTNLFTPYVFIRDFKLPKNKGDYFLTMLNRLGLRLEENLT